MGRKGTPFPTSNLWVKAFPHLELLQCQENAHNRAQGGGKPKCTVPPPQILHFNHCKFRLDGTAAIAFTYCSGR